MNGERNDTAPEAPEERMTLEERYATANDRFKRSFGAWFWGSLVIATVIHFVAFAFWPDMMAEDFARGADEFEQIELPPEVEIPPPPEQIARPATPVIAEANIDEDITIAPTTFEDNPVDDLPPPPDEDEGAVGDQPSFTPRTVDPEMRNRRDVLRAVQRFYPPLLRDAGVEGRVVVWFRIDTEGEVIDARVSESSGHRQMDQAALRVAEVAEFSPAMNRDRRVEVWVQIPITFTIQ